MTKFLRFKLNPIFDPIKTGDFHASSKLEVGNIPLISCKTEKTPDHGVEGYFQISEDKTFENCVTITCDGDQPSTAFYHPYRFAAKDNVLVCIPKRSVRLFTILYTICCINMERWRFSYGRKCYANKLDKLTVPFPVDECGNIDQNKIEEILNPDYFQPIIKKAMDSLKKKYQG